MHLRMGMESFVHIKVLDLNWWVKQPISIDVYCLCRYFVECNFEHAKSKSDGAVLVKQGYGDGVVPLF
jgi:hypothetical protein